VCGSEEEFTDLLGIGFDSQDLDWERTFPGIFSEGPTCTCPCQGSTWATKDKNFRRYLEYNKTFSRFWETDNWVPLLRNAQEKLLKSQQLLITTAGNLFRKPGEIIALDVPVISAMADADDDPTQEFMRGKYMITAIKHIITANNTHTMEMELSRDSFPEPYASIGDDVLSNYDQIIDNNLFGQAFSFDTNTVEYTRDIDTPGFLKASAYSFYWNPDVQNEYVYNTGIPDADGNDILATINYVDSDQKTVASRFVDDPSIGLGFVTPFVYYGSWKDFTSYSWSDYANIRGYYDGSGFVNP
jgi:hypothetical protein